MAIKRKHKIEERDIVAFALQHHWLLLLKESSDGVTAYHWLTPSGFMFSISFEVQKDGSLVLHTTLTT